MKTDLIYFDNNGTTKADPQVITETCKWMQNINNASTNNFLSIPGRTLIEEAKSYILKHCKVNKNDYTVIFTSSGSESNSFIIRSTVMSYKAKFKKKPHIIVSEIEHKSILQCVDCLKEDGYLEVSKIKPDPSGIITVEAIEKAIKKNTCLISIMYANNEIGSINDINSISDIAKKNNIPFHTDAVQIFGKIKLNLKDISAVSASFHKFYSGNGIGLLIINNNFINYFHLKGIISGTQQYSLRGGTESIPLIAGAYKGMVLNFENRLVKNNKLSELKMYTLKKISSLIPVVYYYDCKKYLSKEVLIILFGPDITKSSSHLPNTILLSIYTKSIKFCNVNLKKYLESFGIIVSIGSACLTSSANASHVITAINVPDKIRQGVLRISYGDHNTKKEIDHFIKIFMLGINKQIQLNKYLDKKINFLDKKVKFGKDIILTDSTPNIIKKNNIRSILKK